VVELYRLFRASGETISAALILVSAALASGSIREAKYVTMQAQLGMLPDEDDEEM
jgi:hypothetical protein